VSDLLAAILSAPDDDAPRLVLADQLLERGDPRGEFIRLQVEIARLPEERWEEKLALEERAAELWAEHRFRFVADDVGEAEHAQWRYERGFAAMAWLDEGPVEVLRRAPLLRFLSLQRDFDVPSVVPLLAALPLLETLHVENLDVEDATKLVAAPVLPGHLALSSARRGVTAIVAASSAAGALRHLDVRSSFVDDGDLTALAGMGQLEELAVFGDLQGDLAPLLRSDALVRLRALDMRIVDEALLAVSPFLPQLVKLRVGQHLSLSSLSRATSLGDLTIWRTEPYPAHELRVLAALRLPLHTLALPSHEIQPDGLEVLVAMGLTSLNLHRNLLAGGLAVLGTPAAASLRTLILSECRLTEEDAATLAASPHLADLTTLHLEQNSLGAEGWRRLIASPYLRPHRIVLDHPGDEEVLAAGKARFGGALVHGGAP
jgi:uncharacterized protein (TIGR02996 family)